MNARPRILSNVLIATGGNSLAPADLYFSDKIERIAERAGRKVEWREIADPAEWRRYLTANPSPRFESDREIIDGNGLLLLPGAVDAHVHFNTPGYESREDIEHGSRAAAAGGVTAIADMPCTSVPPVTSMSSLLTKLSALHNRSVVDYALWGGISAQMLQSGTGFEILMLADAGVAGFKCYLTSGMDTFGDLSAAELERAAELVADTSLPLAVHAEDRDRVRSRERKARSEGRRDWRAYAESRDDEAEAAAVAKCVKACRKTGCRMHIVHLSSRRALELVAAAKAEGLPFTAETCPHYLQFTERDFDNPTIAAFLKTAPPVKRDADRDALWQALADGTLDFVTTDHAGCDPALEKSSADFFEVYGGIPGVEHRVPYLLSEGFLRGRITLQRAIELLSVAPARFLGLWARKGELTPGGDADLALIDLWTPWTVRAAEMQSKGKYTPFEGLSLNAKVQSVRLRGERIESASFHGEWIPRGGSFA